MFERLSLNFHHLVIEYSTQLTKFYHKLDMFKYWVQRKDDGVSLGSISKCPVRYPRYRRDAVFILLPWYWGYIRKKFTKEHWKNCYALKRSTGMPTADALVTLVFLYIWTQALLRGQTSVIEIYGFQILAINLTPLPLPCIRRFEKDNFRHFHW